MAAEQTLATLAARKRQLQQEAELHRTVLQMEVAQVRTQLLWVTQVREKLPRSPAWLAGSAVAGLLVARNWRSVLKLIPVGMTAWRWFKKLRAD